MYFLLLLKSQNLIKLYTPIYQPCLNFSSLPNSFSPFGVSGHCAVLGVRHLVCDALNAHGRVTDIRSASWRLTAEKSCLNLTRTDWLLNAVGNQEAGTIYTSREAGLPSAGWPVFSNCRYVTGMFHLYFMELRLWDLDSFAVAMLHFKHGPTSMVKICFCHILTCSHWETGSHKPSGWDQVHGAMAESVRPSVFFMFPCALGWDPVSAETSLRGHCLP